MRLLVLILVVAFSAPLSVPGWAAPAILNEYNAVREDKPLKNAGADPFLGTPAGTPVNGNGSIGAPVGDQNDWFELVTVADGLDMRGWSVHMIEDGNPAKVVTFSNDALWSNLAAGTLIVVFESDDIPEDTDASDFRIAVRVNGNGSTPTTYLSPQADIDVTNSDFELTIRDDRGRVMFGPTGEVIIGGGIGSDEVFKLETDPSALIIEGDMGYNDGTSSTFGAPNVFNAGSQTQDLSALRNGTPVLDADFDGIADCRDNCRDVYNLAQLDGDGDGSGNACDPDFDNDQIVGTSDFNTLRENLGLSAGDAAFDDVFDLNDDETIDSADVAILNASFGGPPGTGAVADPACDINDPTDEIFDPAIVLDVDIQMAPADWDAVRLQTRDLEDALGCAEVPATSPFVYYPATVTVDGQVLTNVGVRKKGFQGSLSTSRPSLKVDFSEFVSGQNYKGLDRLTLNNQRQDPSDINTCMSYYTMRQAGVPAPRCNVARVTVNGVQMGIYANVESIKNPYLIRNFGSAQGNLYEGTISDVRAGYFGKFEIKNGGDRLDLLALAHLLEGTDTEIINELANHMDVPAFMTFWAMEGLIGHWDGYNQGTNNFFVFNDPTTKLRFFPWGADDTFGDLGGFNATPGTTSPSIFLNSQLASRLWQIPAFQAQFLAELQARRDQLFPQGGNAALIAEIDRLETQVNDPADPWFDPARASEIATIRQWAIDRYDDVEAELASLPTAQPLGDRFCVVQATPLDTVLIDIDTTLTDDPGGDPVGCPTCTTAQVTVNGVTRTPGTAFPNPLQQFDRNINPIGDTEIGLLNALIEFPLGVAAIVSVDPSLAPATLPGTLPIVDGLGNGIVAEFSLVDPTVTNILGFMRGAQLDLTMFGTNVGDRIVGQLSGDVLSFTQAPPNPLPPLSTSSGSGGSGPTCGLGAELALLLPGVALLRRRRKGRGAAAVAPLVLLALLAAPQLAEATPVVELLITDVNGTPVAPTSNVTANAGDLLEVTLRVTADAAGISSYGLSIQFDADGANELDLVSAVEVLNAAFDVDLGGPGPLSTTESGPGTAGSVLTIAAGATGAGLTSATFDVAVVTFTVTANVVGDGLDLTVGFLGAADGLFDSAGQDLSGGVTLNGASVPEPGTMSLLVALMAVRFVVARRSMSSHP